MQVNEVVNRLAMLERRLIDVKNFISTYPEDCIPSATIYHINDILSKINCELLRLEDIFKKIR